MKQRYEFPVTQLVQWPQYTERRRQGRPGARHGSRDREAALEDLGGRAGEPRPEVARRADRGDAGHVRRRAHAAATADGVVYVATLNAPATLEPDKTAYFGGSIGTQDGEVVAIDATTGKHRLGHEGAG